MLESIDDLDRKTWEEFSDTGLMWEINKLLIPLGWTIITDVEDDVYDVYPAKIREE